METPDYNFIVVRLGDNDFGNKMEQALLDLINEHGLNFCPVIAKRYIIEYIIGRITLKEIASGVDPDEHRLQSFRDYLNKMTVTFNKKLPTYTPDGEQTIDDDGGSVYYDVNLGKVFWL